MGYSLTSLIVFKFNFSFHFSSVIFLLIGCELDIIFPPPTSKKNKTIQIVLFIYSLVCGQTLSHLPVNTFLFLPYPCWNPYIVESDTSTSYHLWVILMASCLGCYYFGRGRGGLDKGSICHKILSHISFNFALVVINVTAKIAYLLFTIHRNHRSMGYGFAHSFWCKHRQQTGLTFVAGKWALIKSLDAAGITDISVTSCWSTDHRYLLTSLVVTRDIDINPVTVRPQT